MKRVLYIHGANATKRSFAYLATKLPEHEAHHFEYCTKMPVMDNIARAQIVCDALSPDVIIGHSLGGVMAAHLDTSAKRVTLASPFGGSGVANWLPLYSQLMRDIATTSPAILGLRRKTVTDFLSIVANGLDGSGWDGVVSAKSQMKLLGPEYLEYNLNHFEVLVDDDIVDVLAKWTCLAVIS